VIPSADDPIARVTVDMMSHMFPAARRAPIAMNFIFWLNRPIRLDMTQKKEALLAETN